MAKKLSPLEQTMADSNVRTLASAMYAGMRVGLDQPVSYRVGDKEIPLSDFNGPLSYERVLERQVSQLIKDKLSKAGEGGLASIVAGNLQELQSITGKIMEKRTIADVINDAEKYKIDVSALKQYRSNDNFNETIKKLAEAKDPQSKELANALMALDASVNYQFKLKLDQTAYKMHTSYALKRLKASNAPADSEFGKAYKTLTELEASQKKAKELQGQIPYLRTRFEEPVQYALAA